MLQAKAAANCLVKTQLEKVKALKTNNEQLNVDLDQEAIDAMKLGNCIAKYKHQIADMTINYQKVIDNLTPQHIKKSWVKNDGKKGGTE